MGDVELTLVEDYLTCSICGKKYQYRKSLLNHVAKHQGPVEPAKKPWEMNAPVKPEPEEPEWAPIVRARVSREVELAEGNQSWAIIIEDLPGGPGMTILKGVTYPDVSRTLSVLRTFGFRAGATRLMQGTLPSGEP